MRAACLLCEAPVYGSTTPKVTIKMHLETPGHFKGLNGKICGNCFVRLDALWDIEAKKRQP